MAELVEGSCELAQLRARQWRGDQPGELVIKDWFRAPEEGDTVRRQLDDRRTPVIGVWPAHTMARGLETIHCLTRSPDRDGKGLGDVEHSAVGGSVDD